MEKIEESNRACAPTMEQVVNAAMEADSDEDDEDDGMYAMMMDQEQAATQETGRCNIDFRNRNSQQQVQGWAPKVHGLCPIEFGQEGPQ